MGFEKSRVVDQKLAEELICGICRNICENPVSSDCTHIFCLQCIKQLLATNTFAKECPECRINFFPKRTSNANNWVNVGKYCFKFDRINKNIINQLKIKCNFESFGCKQLTEFSSFKKHWKECPFRRCKSCEMPLNSNVDHNCIQVLKKDRNEWKTKFNALNNQNNTLIKNLSSLPLSYKTMTIGDHKSCSSGVIQFESQINIKLSFEVRRIVCIGFLRLCSHSTINFNLWILYKFIDEVMYCLESPKPILIIRLGFQSYKRLLEEFAKYYHLKNKSIGILIAFSILQ